MEIMSVFSKGTSPPMLHPCGHAPCFTRIMSGLTRTLRFIRRGRNLWMAKVDNSTGKEAIALRIEPAR
jgi:hypothetical protein